MDFLFKQILYKYRYILKHIIWYVTILLTPKTYNMYYSLEQQTTNDEHI